MIDDVNNNNINITNENTTTKTTALTKDNTKREDKEEQTQEGPTRIPTPKTKINYNNEFMVIQPTTINYLIATVRPPKKERQSLTSMISKIGKKVKNVIDDDKNKQTEDDK